MTLDAESGNILGQSRERLLIALADAFNECDTRAEFKTKAAELVDFHHGETREICIKVHNSRTSDTQNQRIDVRGIVPSAENITQIMRWGAWLYARGWDTIDFSAEVQITRSAHSGMFYSPTGMMKGARKT